jgi:hypothetical protein
MDQQERSIEIEMQDAFPAVSFDLVVDLSDLE